MRPLVIFPQQKQPAQVQLYNVDQGDRIHSKMATSDKLEASLGQGIKGLKESMKNMNQKAKDKNERAERMEKELAVAKQAHIKAYGRLQALKERKIDIEERIERNNDKIKDLTKRVNEKEKFVEESKKFAKSLKVIVPEEHEVMEMEERLRVQKEIYSQHYEKYNRMKNRKVELEQEFEHAELKAHEACRRMEALNTELEYSQTEEARREEACRAAIDGAFNYEKKCLDLQNGLDHIMQRKEEATKRINKLEKETRKAENATETLTFERKDGSNYS